MGRLLFAASAPRLAQFRADPAWRPGDRALVLPAGASRSELAHAFAEMLGTGADLRAVVLCPDAPMSGTDAPTAAKVTLVAALEAVQGWVDATAACETAPRLLVASHGAFRFGTYPAGETHAAVLPPMVRSAALDVPGLAIASVDLDPADPRGALAALQAEALHNGDEPETAWRDGQRFVPRLQRARIETPVPDAAGLAGGLCLVVGGLGGLGHLLCGWLHERWGASVVVVGRSPLDGDDPTAMLRRERLAGLRATGARVAYHCCDTADAQALAGLMAAVERTAGRPMSAVFHLASAGRLDDTLDAAGSVQALTPEGLDALFAAKLATAAATADALAARPDVALVLFSSVNGVFGGLGYTAYSAANGYLDRLATDRVREGGRAVSLAWTGWDDIGMSAGASESVLHAMTQAGFATIGRHEGLASLAAGLASGLPHVLIGLDGTRQAIAGRTSAALAPAYRLAGVATAACLLPPAPRDRFGTVVEPQVIVTDDPPHDAHGALDAAATVSRRGAAAHDDAPTGEIEHAVAALWRSVLRLGSVGRSENFFVLGGNSILGTQMILQVNATFGVSLPVAALFEHATVAKLAARLGDAVAGDGQAAEPDAGPQPAGRALVPATPPQKRLWLLHQFDGAAAAYNVPMAVRLRGAINPDAIRAALAYLATRHEAFRMRFVADPRDVSLAIDAAAQVPLSVVDATGWSADALQAALDEAAARVFDLAAAPLAAGWLFRTGDEEAVYLLSMHHAIVDGWSLPVIAEDFATAYLAAQAGATPAATRAPVDYSDYALWLERRLQSEPMRAQVAYWQERLAGVPALLALPTDRPRPPAFSYRGALHDFSIPAEIAERVRGFARERGETLFAALASALAIVLSRYSGQRDIVLGTPVANRPHQALGRMVGMFVNTIPVRITMPRRACVGAVLDAANRSIAEAISHADLPFERLIELAGVPRDPSHSPLFQVMLVLQTAQDGEMALPGLTITPLAADPHVAKYDLNIAISDGDGELAAHVEYASDLFDPVTVAGLADDLVAALAAMPAAAEREADTLALPPHVVAPPAAAPVAYRGNVYARFVDQCARQGAAPAVVTPDATLSFAGLAQRVEGIAAALVAHGVGPGVIVGATLERSADLTATLLACLRLGATYLPMAANDPVEHRAAVAEDAGCALVLSDGSAAIAGALPVLRLDTIGAADPMPAVIVPAVAVLPPSAPAYIIYTSGSTGRPKGVVITHGALDNMAEASTDLFGDGAGRTMLRTSRISFDMSIFELLLGVLRGAAECPLSHEQSLSPVAATAVIQGCGVTDMLVPPSVLALYDPADLTGVTRIMVGGEACPLDLARKWAPGRTFLNGYGPTETTICASAKRLVADSAAVTIGTAIRGLSLHVVNGRLRPLPVGAIGELCVGGIGVASHYHARPGLSAERFVPDPFAARPGSVMYRTGDLCRVSAQGEVEFVGRADQQVKIRGHRIELADIEAVLLRHDAVENVAVLAPVSDRQATLVAFVAVRDLVTGPLPDALQAALRTTIAAQRPDYCMPHRFVGLPSVPLSANGKADHAALLALLALLDDLADEAHTDQVAPEGADEVLLAQVWAQLLGRDSVGVTANFFELGGDSMVAMRMISALRDHGRKVTARQVFSLPTVRQLAPALEMLSAEADYQHFGREPALPMAHWLFESRPDALDHMNQALTLAVAPGLGSGAVVAAVRQVFARQPALAGARFDAAAGTMELAPGGSPPSVQRIDLSALQAGDRAGAARRAGQFAHRSFVPAQGRVVQALLFEGGAHGERWLWLLLHHLVSDIHSLGLLHADLERAAAGALGADRSAMPLIEWSRQMQRAAEDRDVVAAETRHWRRLGSELAAIRTRNPAPGGARVQVERLCDAGAIAGFNDAATHEAFNTRPIDLIVAALARALGGLGDERRVALTLEEHGRSLPHQAAQRELDASRSIGWFTALHPLLVAPRDASAAAAVVAAKEARLAAPSGGVGFGLMRYVTHDAEARASARAIALPPVLLNFSGSLGGEARDDAWFAAAPHDSGAWSDPAAPSDFALELNCGVVGGGLWLELNADVAAYPQARLARLADAIAAALPEVIVAARGAGAVVYTPTDFADLDLDQDDLDLLIAEIEQ